MKRLYPVDVWLACCSCQEQSQRANHRSQRRTAQNRRIHAVRRALSDPTACQLKGTFRSERVRPAALLSTCVCRRNLLDFVGTRQLALKLLSRSVTPESSKMNKQERIMCAVDLSWRSERRFNYAVALAPRCHGTLAVPADRLHRTAHSGTRGGASERCCRYRKSCMDGCTLRSVRVWSSTRSCGTPTN